MLGSRVVTAAAAVLLLALAPPPAASVEVLRQSSTAADPTVPVVAAAALTGQLLVGWIVLVCLLTLLARLPGILGRAARAGTRVVAPRTVRRAVELALGISIAVATPAAAASPTPPPAPGPSYDWPTAPVPLLDPAPPAAPPPVPDVAAPPPERTVVVRPGDSLWRIAARHLPPAATDREVAQAWPRWWSANRAVIGPNPDLVHPGLRLQPPA